MKTVQELKTVFLKAYTILTASVLRAQILRAKAEKIRYTKNPQNWLKNMKRRDELIRLADMTENRGRKIWVAVTNFQGKYVNWRHLTDDGFNIYEIILSIPSQYDNILPIAKKIA